jgi:hypothetical protein
MATDSQEFPTPAEVREVRAGIAWALRRFRRAAKVATSKRDRTILERGQVELTCLLRRYNTAIDRAARTK